MIEINIKDQIVLSVLHLNIDQFIYRVNFAFSPKRLSERVNPTKIDKIH